MKDKISIAIIGLGKRGSGLLRDILVKRKDLDIVAVCDVYEDRTAQAAKTITDDGRPEPKRYTDYKLLLEEVKTDSVLISCSWEWHIEIAIAAMKAGIAVALEVGGCFSMEELWSLVHTQEETGTPFMFMENCCFGRSELLATGAYRAGALGTVVACEGSYTHDLREEIAGGNINRHYRLRNYIHRNCDNYPTHDAGPIAKLLNINRGNKFVSLVSVSSKACGLREYVAERPDKYPDLQDVEFNQGDIVTTIITCANGETVTLRLNTTLPTFYSRDFVVRGTKGMYNMNARICSTSTATPRVGSRAKCIRNSTTARTITPNSFRKSGRTSLKNNSKPVTAEWTTSSSSVSSIALNAAKNSPSTYTTRQLIWLSAY